MDRIARTLHLVPDAAFVRAAAVFERAEAAHGVTTRVIGPLPTPSSPENALETACRWNGLALAEALRQTALPVDVVVAHGWCATPAAERIASRSGTALVVVAHPAGLTDVHPEFATWGAGHADGVLEPLSSGVDAADAGRQVLDAYVAARAGRRSRVARAPLDERARTYDVVVRAEDLSPDCVDALLVRLPRVAVLKGATPEVWRQACARSRMAAVAAPGSAFEESVEAAASSGCLPVCIGPRTGDPRLITATETTLFDTLAGWLADAEGRQRLLAQTNSKRKPGPSALGVKSSGAASPRPARPLRLVLNHGGLVAEELQQSLAPYGWNLRPLLGPGRDPLPAADLLVVLPYGDPRGALEAVRRAKRVGVPAAFWNVEDPRYFFDPELGPLVLAAAREATATFSTTTQLAAEYRAHGVQVQYLPNYGRTFFHVDEPLDDTARTIDVLFLGTLTTERRSFLDAYRARLGPDVALVVRDDVREPSELCDLARSARLGLSVGTLTDAVTPNGPLRGQGVTERVFDYPLAGTPVLSDARDHLADVFDDDREVFVFRDVDQAAALTDALLRDPERRAQAVAGARQKILAEHMGRHRLLSIVEALATHRAASPALGVAARAARALRSEGCAS